MSDPSRASGHRIEAAATAWLAIDPDPVTRAETASLLAARDEAGLADRFADRLVFGTAGLRGALGAGPNRMNRVVVMQTSAGLARFLLARAAQARSAPSLDAPSLDGTPSAVIGYDGRHNSKVFAEDAAGVLAAAGVAVTLLPRALPTPVLAFAVRDLDASAGVMITASHNPAPDNGYKLYLGGVDAGSQLVPPADGQVLAAIGEVVDAGGLPPSDPGLATVADDAVLQRYVAATVAASGVPSPEPLERNDPSRELPWVYTPLHGVGLETARLVLTAAGLPSPAVVAEQAAPDPDFPTAPFPNPEEPGTLDLVVALADRDHAALVLANDPDADRLAVAVPDAGGWRRLTGNEVGLLLGWRIAATASAGTLACSIVSTPGLARIAGHFGLDAIETLTGFKWISRAPGLVFGFEEALGYLVDPGVVRDKDGVSALVAVLSAAVELRAQGRSLLDLLADVEAAIGRYDSDQVSVRTSDLAEIPATMHRLRTRPPTMIGGFAVLGSDDLAAGSAQLPPSDVLRYRLEGDARVIVRPSGTEPKVKVYLDVVSTAASPAARVAETTAALAALRAGVPDLLG